VPNASSRYAPPAPLAIDGYMPGVATAPVNPRVGRSGASLRV
jgi:hypothetical protein